MRTKEQAAVRKRDELQNVIKNIIDSINYKNTNLGTDLEFLGFVGGKYVNYLTKILLKCNIHGNIWESSITSLIKYPLNKACPACINEKHISNSENLCFNLIKKFCDKDIQQQYVFRTYDYVYKRKRRLYVDFYIKDLNLIIEYDGEQHFSYTKMYHHDNYSIFVNQVNRDNCLKDYCKENSINLLRISYKDKNRLEEVIKAFFIDGKDITTKVDPILLPIKYEGGTVNG